jgi:hypothetical protein
MNVSQRISPSPPGAGLIYLRLRVVPEPPRHILCRYARFNHVYPRALVFMGSGKLDVKPLIADTFSFADSIKAFDYALHVPPTSVKVQITVAKD